MAVSTMKKYSADKIDWFLTEEGLKGVVEQFSHPENNKRHYEVYNYQGGKIFIKSFLERGFTGRIRHYFAPRGKTEFLIGSKLASFDILTPKVFGYGIGKNHSCVAEEYIEGQSLLDAMKKTTERRNILTGLAGLLRELQLKGVRHNDLHLDNVLIHGDRLYLIDLHKTKIKKDFNDADEVSNFTHALGIIYDDILESDRNFLFAQYHCGPAMRRKIEQEIARLKKNWIVNKKKRAFKNTSMLRASGDYVYMKGAEAKANGEFIAFLKKDKKVRVERFSDHIRKTYQKQGRLKMAWENHVVLAYLKSAAAPQAFFVKLPILSSNGYIAMEDLGDRGVELDRFLDGKYDNMDLSERKRFTEGFARFLQTLFRQRITHRDMKGCNIFALHDGGFVFLDVEDFVFQEIGEEALTRMLTQLNTTVPKRISSRDRMRFFLKLTVSLNIDKKRLFKNIVSESKKSDIVYEGVGGLKREQW
jgi:tRNA A-37 threonylcarbamoyl transferase component Bud32